MSLQLQTNSIGYVRESEHNFGLMIKEILQCLKSDNQSMIDLLVLYETIKKNVLSNVEDRNLEWRKKAQVHSYQSDLSALEQKLLTTDGLFGKLRCMLFMLLAMLHYGFGNFRKTKEMALVARCEYNLWGMDNQAAFADFLLALCCMEMGEFEEAADRCVLAIHETEADADPAEAARFWQIYANVLCKMGRPEEAVASLLIAHELYARIGATVRQVKTTLNLSLVLAAQADWHGCIYHLKKVLPLCYHNNLQSLELEILHMLIHIYQKLDRKTEYEGCQLRISRILSESASTI